GRTTSRSETFWIRNGSVQFKRDDGAAAGATSIVFLDRSAPRAATVLGHDGASGRISSGAGPLTFRTGDVLAGEDGERMRLTADGRLGIGVEEPAARLDVAGLIRTSEGIQFPDGSIQRTAAEPAAGPRAAAVVILGQSAVPGVLGSSAVSATDQPGAGRA